MAVTAISNGSGLNALVPSARAATRATDPGAPLARPSAAPDIRQISPTGAPAAPPVTGGPKKPAVDLPGQLAAQVGGGEKDAKQPGELTDEEKQVVAKLRERDAEVHRHEQAHAAAGGQYAGAPSYEYQQGPDGKQYAVGGETPIDVSPIPGDPEATARKMEQVRRAALAPADPSGQDQAIAAAASAAAAQASQEASKQKAADAQGGGQGGDQGPAPAGQPSAAPQLPGQVVPGQVVSGQAEPSIDSAVRSRQIGAYQSVQALGVAGRPGSSAASSGIGLTA
jgi:hypothetical protein